jgi:hypothetical protein
MPFAFFLRFLAFQPPGFPAFYILIFCSSHPPSLLLSPQHSVLSPLFPPIKFALKPLFKLEIVDLWW